MLEIEVNPRRGADISSLRFDGTELLFQWDPEPHPANRFLDGYRGGWQTIFPNGGDQCHVDGVTLPFHGEAALVPWQEVGDRTYDVELALLPFRLRKRISVDGDTVTVEETATNVGSRPYEVMWSHHPAFGEPFLSPECIIESTARNFVVDDERRAPHVDLTAGETLRWPSGLDHIESVPLERFGYLTDFDRGFIALTNPRLGIRAELTWNVEVLPHAWYWLEGKATADAPWFGKAYALGLEPASSYPGQGLAKVRLKTGNQLFFEPGQRRTVRIRLAISHPN